MSFKNRKLRIISKNFERRKTVSEKKLTITIPCPFCGESLEFEVEIITPKSSFSVIYGEKERKKEFQVEKCICGKEIIFRGCSILLYIK